MKKRDICWIIILFIFMWMAIAGQYLNITDEYGLAWLYGFVELIIISFFMMIIPFIYRIKNKERLDIDKGIKICKWNSLGMFFLSIFLSILILDGNGMMGIGGVGAVIFYFINKSIFVYDENMPKKEKKIEVKKITEENAKEIPETLNNNIKINNSKTKYCKLCGGKVDENKKCKKCGKQYFKFNKNIVCYSIIGILVISNIFCILMYNDAKESANNDWCIDELYNLIGTDGFLYTKDKLDFYDEHIVFVIEGYGKHYYSYDCVQKITSDDNYSFWAYNEEAAKENGYTKGYCN